MSAFPRLFSAGRIGRLTLKNRILMAPMEKNLALPTGGVSQRYIDYCEARAVGGAALILLESTAYAPPRPTPWCSRPAPSPACRRFPVCC